MAEQRGIIYTDEDTARIKEDAASAKTRGDAGADMRKSYAKERRRVFGNKFKRYLVIAAVIIVVIVLAVVAYRYLV